MSPATRPPVDGAALFDAARAEILRLVSFPDDRTADICVLWVGMAWVSPALRTLFYLAIQGPRGSGKTTLLSILQEMSPRPFRHDRPSEAALARSFPQDGKPYSVFMDEIDEASPETLNAILQIIRTGYRLGGTWNRASRDGGKVTFISTFCPKAFTYRGQIEDAAQDRTYPIYMARAADPYAYHDSNESRDLRPLLSAWKRWAPKGRAAVRDMDMARLVRIRKNALGSIPSPRDVEIGSILVRSGMAMGLSDDRIAGILHYAAELRDSADRTDDISLLRECFADVVKTHGKPYPETVPVSEIRLLYNMKRSTFGDRPVGAFILGRLFRELGIRDREDVFRVPTGTDPTRPTVVRLNERVLRLLGVVT